METIRITVHKDEYKGWNEVNHQLLRYTFRNHFVWPYLLSSIGFMISGSLVGLSAEIKKLRGQFVRYWFNSTSLYVCSPYEKVNKNSCTIWFFYEWANNVFASWVHVRLGLLRIMLFEWTLGFSFEYTNWFEKTNEFE